MPFNIKNIRAEADKLRLNNNASVLPISPEKLANSLGIEILSKPVEDELCGFLYKGADDEKVIIGVNSNHPPNRRRFTVAHEIGHYVLHNYKGFHFDSENQNYLLKLRKKNSKLNLNEEREANTFAAELLMPKKLVEQEMLEYKDVDLLFGSELPRLARKFQVSVRALTYRLINLGHIKADQDID